MHLKTLKNRWFGDRYFYQAVLTIAVPIMIQSGITTFVNMLDNIMVGQVGTLPMSGVSISNQLMMIFNLAVFGCNAAAGIFGAQFYGKGDRKGVRNCFHFKLMVTVLVSIVGITVLGLFGRNLISLYLNPETNSAADMAATMEYAREYMLIMMIGLPAFTLSQAFSSSIRESGETVIPMTSSITAVLVNFVGNYVLIFGHFGFPKLGIAGAAIATVISRFVELTVIIFRSLRRREQFWFYDDGLKNFGVPAELAEKIIKRGTPLVINEVLWSVGLAAIMQCYSTRGLNAVAAININQTIHNVFSITNMATGQAIAIMVGQKLGANLISEAVDTNRKLIVFAGLLTAVMGCLMFITAPLFPGFYNTSDEVRQLASQLLRVTSLMLPVGALYNAAYHTLRSGGRTFITFLFDSVYTCTVNLTLAFILTRFTDLGILSVYIYVQLADVLKVIIGMILVHKGIWIRNLVDGKSDDEKEAV